MIINQAPKTNISNKGKEFLLFNGTSYLGISENLEFINQLKSSISNWGVSYGSSRSANIQLSIYEEGENLLAKLLEQESAITTSSGTLSGMLTVKTLEKENDLFFYMPKTHPSILPKNSFPVFVNGKLNILLKKCVGKNIVIVTDAIAALETQPFSFNFLEKISLQANVTLLVDLSHYFGVFNNILPFKLYKNIDTIFVSSLGKAYGINGGVIAGNLNFIQKIKNSALFKGAAGMSPSFLECFIKSQDIYLKQSKKLKENCKYIYHKLKDNPKIKIAENYPVSFYDDDTLADYLFSKNIIITSFQYPTSVKKLNRIVVNACHTKKQLDFLIKQIQLV